MGDTQTFPAQVVKELREKADRYRRRARTLESALIRAAIEANADRIGLPRGAIPSTALARVFVDEAGIVHGAAEAVASLHPA